MQQTASVTNSWQADVFTEASIAVVGQIDSSQPRGTNGPKTAAKSFSAVGVLARRLSVVLLAAPLLALPNRAAEPEIIVREEALRAIDTVELFRNGVYWWTASACTETPNLGGAAYLACADPRLISSTANRYSSLRGSSGGFKPGDIFDPGLSVPARISGLKGMLLPDCGYGAHFVRDDEAFYYAKNRQLHRKPLNALSVMADGQLMLSWRAADVDQDTLHFAVMLSPDDGESWRTVTVNYPETSLAIPGDLLPGTPTARVRVIATDGVHSAIATTEPFQLPRHPPEVRITGVADGQQVDFGTPFSAQGFGYDPEDGTLAEAALRWALAGPESRQASGGTLPLSDLPPGAYALTLSGTASDGQTSTQVLRFVVRPLAVAEGQEPQTWPPAADIDQPSSWASGQAKPAASQELVVNGSFESTQNTFVPDAFGLMSLSTTSATIPGWTTTDAELAWVDNTNTFGAATPFGRFSVELTGYHDALPFGGLTQAIATVPGQVYRLSLSLGSNQDYPNAGGQKAIAVCVGSASTTLTFVPTNTAGNQWQTFSFRFAASSASTMIAIRGLMASGIYLGLDNVSVVADPLAPAPGALELVKNGSFESTCTFTSDRNGIMTLPPGSIVIPGWTTTGAELAWGINGNAFGLRSFEGSMFVDLSGYQDRPPYGGITQTLATVLNEIYRLSFSLGSNEASPAFRGPVSVAVTAGSTSNSFTFTPAGPGDQWGRFTMDFRADSPVTPLTITGTESTGGSYLGLDSVSVTPTSASEGLRITIVDFSSKGLTIGFPSESGRQYVIESRFDLSGSEWVAVPGTAQAGTGAWLSVTLSIQPSQPQRFYRVRGLP